MTRRSSIVSGVLLVLAGSVLLLHNFRIFYFADVWPLFLVVVGISLFATVRGKSDKGGVFPATILLLLGVFFFLERRGYIPDGIEGSWPIFLIIVGVAFMVLFACQPDRSGSLIPGLILLFLGAVFTLDQYDLLPLDAKAFVLRSWPIVLILIGAAMILKRWQDGKRGRDGA